MLILSVILLVIKISKAIIACFCHDSHQVHATIDETNQPKWWEKTAAPNMVNNIHSTQEFLSALSEDIDRLVIVEFWHCLLFWVSDGNELLLNDHLFLFLYASLFLTVTLWGCLPCKIAEEHLLFFKVNFIENKPTCKSLNIKVLPYFSLLRYAYCIH